MTACELAMTLGAAIACQDGWPFQAKIMADQAAKSAACRLVASLQGDPELRKNLEILTD
jgi:hypothetical protein